MSLSELLKIYKPSDENEQKMVYETIDFIEKNNDCFERTLLAGHITASAWTIDKTHQYTLLTHHRKLNKWFQLGGHCDGDTNVLNVALKEALEESGLSEIKVLSEMIFDVDIHQIPEAKGFPAHLHYDIRFLLEADKNEPFKVSEESHNLAWILLQDVHLYNQSESILRMVRKTI